MLSTSSRLHRYHDFIDTEFANGLTRPGEYSLEDLKPELAQRIRDGRFRSIVFTGMGCSAIVSDVIRGFLVDQGIPLDVFVLNDYDPTYLLPAGVLGDETTLVIISSYSGHSREPLIALESLSAIRDRIVLLTSGGPLGEQGRELGVSAIYWRLDHPDREYPLFHVTQYFAILLDVFARLGLLPHNHQPELVRLADDLAAGVAGRQAWAERVADQSRDAKVLLVASPKWHETLLKLAKMHLNEIAMVPAGRNFLHEFCHSEIASLSDSRHRHSLIVFVDGDDDDYTKAKVGNFISLLTEERPENALLTVTRIDLEQPTFLARLFGALDQIQRLTLELGLQTPTRSRDLISEAAGNRWYHSSTIEHERTASVV